MTPNTDEVAYLVLAHRAAPYLLARVRWPDIAQAITVGSPDWLDDPGLFDLPYDPSVLRVSFTQAASIAAGWGRQLRAEAAEGAPSFVRRMPATWSNLSPAERRTWGIESVGGRRPSARRVRRLRSFQATIGAPAPVSTDGNGHARPLTDGRDSADLDDSDVTIRRTVAANPRGAATDHRRFIRVRLSGRIHIVSGQATISAGLVDVSEGGVRCVLPDSPPVFALGAALDGPFVLEAEITTSRVCLGVGGRISWNRRITGGTHFGVAFDALKDGHIEGLQRFMIAAGSRGGSR